MYIPKITEADNGRLALEGAIEMARLGFAVFPLRPGTKDGFYYKGSWKDVATNDLAKIEALASKHLGCNWGAWCKGHVVLDVDVVGGKKGEAQFVALETTHGLPATRTHASARGGQHVIYRLPPGVEVGNSQRGGAGLGDAIDVRGDGGYIVCPGSHFEGRPYTMTDGSDIAEAPTSLVELLRRPTDDDSVAAPVPATFDAVRAAHMLTALPRTRDACDAADKARGWRDRWIEVGMALHHASGGGEDGFGVWLKWSAESESFEGEADCRTRWRSFGKPGSRPVTLGTLESRARRYGWVDPTTWVDPADLTDLVADTTSPVATGRWNPPGRNARGRVYTKSRENFEYFIKFEGGTFWINEFTKELQIQGFSFTPDGRVTDATGAALRDKARERGLDPASGMVFDYCLTFGGKNSRHPVREYLDSLQWDGVPRVANLLSLYLGADKTPFNEAVGTMLMVAAVRRVRQPGAKYDYLIVLEGPQGAGKSLFVKKLAGQWHTDSLNLGAEHREVIEQTRDAWFVEIPELAGMRSAKGREHIKHVITSTVDRARAAYGTHVEDVPRQWVAVATTNERDYLTDPTGHRRFLPVAVKNFDLHAFMRDRDQLWAEAVQSEKKYGPLVLPASVKAAAEALQESRERLDPVFEVLRENFDGLRGYVPTKVVFEVAEGAMSRGLGNAERQGVNAAMGRLGFRRDRMPSGRKISVFRNWEGPLSAAPMIVPGGHGPVPFLDDDTKSPEYLLS